MRSHNTTRAAAAAGVVVLALWTAPSATAQVITEARIQELIRAAAQRATGST